MQRSEIIREQRNGISTDPNAPEALFTVRDIVDDADGILVWVVNMHPTATAYARLSRFPNGVHPDLESFGWMEIPAGQSWTFKQVDVACVYWALYAYGTSLGQNIAFGVSQLRA